MTTTPPPTTTNPDELRAVVRRLGLYGLLAHWPEVHACEWLPTLVAYEEDERRRRSLERRLRFARLGAFKPMADFDWQWPTKIDRAAIEELSTLDFLDERANVVLVGPNGIGKTMIAQHLAHRALLGGATVRFTTASAMLNDLAAQDSASALNRRLRHYSRPQLLAIDELGYLSYDSRLADLLFEVVTRRYNERSTLITTNKTFAEWQSVFPNAACVVTLVDRLIHKAEILTIEGNSYRLKEAQERAALKAKNRKSRPSPQPK